MKTLTKREVGQTPAALWAAAEEGARTGEQVFVLNKGKPAYRVEYIGDADPDPLAALVAQGLVTPPHPNPAPPPERGVGSYTADEIMAIYEELRGDN